MANIKCVYMGRRRGCVCESVRAYASVCVLCVCVCGVWDGGGGEDVFERACVRACM